MLAVLTLVAALLGADLPVRVPVPGNPRVTIRAEAGMDALAAELAERVGPSLNAIYEDLDGLPRPAAIEIRLVKESGSLQRVAPAGARVPEWAAGVAFAGAGVVAVATRRGPEPIDVGSTLDHELAHMALDAALGGRAPRWLNEGFAYLHSSDFSVARTSTLAGMAWSGDYYPLGEIEGHFPEREDHAARAYAQSYDFVFFLAQRGRWPDADDDGDRNAFRRFLAGIAAGADPYRAALEAYGSTLSELQSEWYESMRKRYMWSLMGMFALAVWVFGALLLVIGWLRKRRENRRRLALWAVEEEGGAPPGVLLH